MTLAKVSQSKTKDNLGCFLPSFEALVLWTNKCKSAAHEIHYLLHSGTPMPLEDYQTIARVGSGRYASVYRVRRLSDGVLFAMKKIQLARMSPRQRTNALSEVRLLSAIRHPNVLSLIEAFYDAFIETLCLVLELAEEGDLNGLLIRCAEARQALAQEEIWGIVEQVGSGLQFLHSHGVLHRDIKVSNILIFRNGAVKIGDLNVSKLDNGLSYTRTGTLTYASPQVWKGERYGSKSDIWSFGCVLYEMLCLRKPFEGENMEEIFKRITKGQYDKIAGQRYSRELRDLPTYMLQLNPKLRPSAATICKMARNKIKRPHQQRQETISFNLTTFAIPGLPECELSPHHNNSSIEGSVLRRQSMSRHKLYLVPIPQAPKPNRDPDASRQTKSRYNGRNIGKLPSFLIESSNTNTQEMPKESLQCSLNNASNVVFKRHNKNHKLKLLRRYTEL